MKDRLRRSELEAGADPCAVGVVERTEHESGHDAEVGWCAEGDLALIVRVGIGLSETQSMQG